MNRAQLRLAALVLPLVGLSGLWLITDRGSRDGTEWDVPIQGYDPRDLLQGHYVQFQYDWPGLRTPEPMGSGMAGNLCLSGPAPTITQTLPGGEAASCPGRMVRAADAMQGRLYASQAEARRLQDQLWDQKLQARIRIRLRADGHITPLGLTFRPRTPAPAAPR